ncbi:MAG: lysoplasmalogenase [Clostridiales bacterium]|nr:lysoplasmalogenase [Clostridiales bacterium]
MYLLLIPTIYFNAIDYSIIKTIVKGGCSLCFLLCGYFSYKKCTITNKKYSTSILLGLFFGMLADIFISLNFDYAFHLGAATFAIGHFFFIKAFVSYSSINKKDIIITTVLLAFFIFLISIYDNFNFNGLFPIVFIYDLVISFMLAKALSLLKFRKKNKTLFTFIPLGALLFYISDYILLFIYFAGFSPTLGTVLNLSIYYTGQAIIALSLYRNCIININICK